MRISDWSSDVCSSDLSASPNLSLLSSSKPSPGIYQTEPAEKLGKLLKPLHKDLQLAITDLLPPRLMINAAEEDYAQPRSEEHTSELQSLMRISSAVFCLQKKHNHKPINDDMPR